MISRARMSVLKVRHYLLLYYWYDKSIRILAVHIIVGIDHGANTATKNDVTSHSLPNLAIYTTIRFSTICSPAVIYQWVRAPN